MLIIIKTFFTEYKVFLLYLVFFMLAANFSLASIVADQRSIATIFSDEYHIEILLFPFYFLFFRVVSKNFFLNTFQVRLNESRKLSLAKYYAFLTSFSYTMLYVLADLAVIFIRGLIPFTITIQDILIILNQLIIYFILSFLLLFFRRSKISLIGCLCLCVVSIVDYFQFYAGIAYFFNIVGNNENTLAFIRNTAGILIIIFSGKHFASSGQIQREFAIRWQAIKVMFLLYIVLITYTLWECFNYKIYFYFTIYKIKFLDGLTQENVVELLQGDFFSFPFLWYFVLLIYFVSLGSARYDDWYSTGLYLRIRTTEKNFVKVKNISLLFLSLLFNCSYFYLPLILEQMMSKQQERINFLSQLSIFFIFWLVLYAGGLLYEYLSMLVTPKLSLVILSILIFINVLVGKGIFFNLLMLNQTQLGLQAVNLGISLFIVVCIIGLTFYTGFFKEWRMKNV